MKAFFSLFFDRRHIDGIGLKNVLTYFFFQRILRINSHVPWPVHWASNVLHPDKIVMHNWRPFPGYLPGCYIQAKNGIEIGKNVRMGPGIKIVSANHDVNNYDLHKESEKIVIGDNVWLSANCVILPGVQLGDHTVVAAGAVVNKSFKGNCIIGGVPAKVISSLPEYANKNEAK